jgi:glycosyltransferase involved in cell wall biosynthesis
MRVLFLNPNGTVGGAETSLLHLMAALRTSEPGWTLSLIAGNDGPLLSRAEALGVSAGLVKFPSALERVGDAGAPQGTAFLGNLVSGGLGVPPYVRRLRKAIREFRPDVVHSNGFKMHLFSAFARESGVPVIWHIHDYVRSRPVAAPLLRLCAHRCSAAVANSHSVAEDLRAVSPNMTIEAVHNGIDVDAFAPNGPLIDLDAKAGLPPMQKGGVRVGLLATFARWKGHEIFFRALALLGKATSVRGYVIGGPIYHTNGSQYTVSQLQALVRQLGLTGKVGFTGYVDDPAQAIRSLDVMVHASTKPEPFGMVIPESWACGKPVIVSNAGGASEIVRDRVNSLTYEPGDATALSRLIDELASSSRLRAEIGEAGRAIARERFNSLRFATEFAAIYRRVARA